MAYKLCNKIYQNTVPVPVSRPTCMGLRLMFSGTPSAPALIRYSNMCNTQGIGIIGSQINISNNKISLPDQKYGSQAISLGFVGSHDITVDSNSTSGGYWGIITDGSFPLYQNVDLIASYWRKAINGTQPIDDALKAKYISTDGPFIRDAAGHATDLHYTGTESEKQHDFLLFGQYVLDWGSHTNTDGGVGRVKNCKISNNTIASTQIGISLFQTDSCSITGNTVSAKTPLKLDKATGISQSGNNF